MGFIIRALIGVSMVVGLFFIVVFGASELAGEVITLRTYHADGLATETPLWIIDEGGRKYIRAGNPESSWFQRLQADPNVEVVRDGVTTPYRTVVVVAMRDRVNLRMAEKYGWGEWLLGLIRDKEGTTPIRLDRAAP
ncbi:MAG: hypothetical protein JRG92_17875 [Deltaproteobacteria bacterium]|nr:hypothetical protein [Deltaproteobacteria bacterium]MBW2696890.1 hypothetical protein [Deltaproteobacteria bacterium]